MERQLEIDFSTRGGRLRLLDSVQLPERPKTTPAAMLSVLRAIESCARGKETSHPKIRTLQQMTNFQSRAKVDRAIAGLKALYLLDTKRTGRYCVYTICWGNLADYVPTADAIDHADEGSRAKSELAPMPNQSWHHAKSELAPVLNQSWHHANSKEALLETQQEPPPPNGAWAAVEVLLRDELEIGKWQACIDACSARGESPAAVMAIVDAWRDPNFQQQFERPDGALAWRLESGNWPRESDEAARRRRRDQQRAIEQAQQQRRDEEAEQSRRDRDELARATAECEKLSDARVQEIISATGNRLLIERLRRHGRGDGLVITALYDALEQSAGTTAEGER